MDSKHIKNSFWNEQLIWINLPQRWEVVRWLLEGLRAPAVQTQERCSRLMQGAGGIVAAPGCGRLPAPPPFFSDRYAAFQQLIVFRTFRHLNITNKNITIKKSLKHGNSMNLVNKKKNPNEIMRSSNNENIPYIKFLGDVPELIFKGSIEYWISI